MTLDHLSVGATDMRAAGRSRKARGASSPLRAPGASGREPKLSAAQSQAVDSLSGDWASSRIVVPALGTPYSLSGCSAWVRAVWVSRSVALAACASLLPRWPASVRSPEPAAARQQPTAEITGSATA